MYVSQLNKQHFVGSQQYYNKLYLFYLSKWKHKSKKVHLFPENYI